MPDFSPTKGMKLDQQTREHYARLIRQWQAERRALSKEWDKHHIGSGARVDIAGKMSSLGSLIEETQKELGVSRDLNGGEISENSC